jgi:KDO2-lipid IV(A) lauroyltransferase
MARKHWFNPIKYAIEAAGAFLLFALLRLLPLDTASNLGAWVGRTIGPYMKAHQYARLNLRLIFPEISQAAHQDILRQMWEHLGRVLFEFPFVSTRTMSKRMEIIGAEHVQEAIASGKPVILFSGHIGNWELCAKTAYLLGHPLILIYRPTNNPWVDKLIHFVRGKFYAGMFAKGQSGAIRISKAIKMGVPVGVLMDQKMNNGIAVPFLGYPAMTAHAMAQYALRYDALILPGRVIRKEGARFQSIIYPPLEPVTCDTQAQKVEAVVRQINDTIGAWVREHPEQWFWVHQRWGKPHEVAAMIEKQFSPEK